MDPISPAAYYATLPQTGFWASLTDVAAGAYSFQQVQRAAFGAGWIVAPGGYRGTANAYPANGSDVAVGAIVWMLQSEDGQGRGWIFIDLLGTAGATSSVVVKNVDNTQTTTNLVTFKVDNTLTTGLLEWADEGAGVGHLAWQGLQLRKGGTQVGPETVLEVIDGANVTLTVADDATNHRVQLTVAVVASPTFTTVNATTVNTTNLTVTGTLTVATFSITTLSVTSLTVGGVAVQPLEVENVDATEITNPCNLLQADNGDGRIQTTDLGGGSAILSWQGLDLIKGSTDLGPQPNLEVIAGDNVNITIGEDIPGKKVQATFSATCGIEIYQEGFADISPLTKLTITDGLRLSSPGAGLATLASLGEILQVGGTDYGPERKLRVVAGAGVSVSGADDAGNNRTVLTITNTDTGSAASGTGTEFTDTTTNAFVTVFDKTSVKGLIGAVSLKNTGVTGHNLNWRITATDLFGHTATSSATGLSPGATTNWSLLSSVGLSGVFFPYLEFQLEVQSQSSGNSTTYDAWLVLAN